MTKLSGDVADQVVARSSPKVQAQYTLSYLQTQDDPSDNSLCIRDLPTVYLSYDIIVIMVTRSRK